MHGWQGDFIACHRSGVRLRWTGAVHPMRLSALPARDVPRVLHAINFCPPLIWQPGPFVDSFLPLPYPVANPIPERVGAIPVERRLDGTSDAIAPAAQQPNKSAQATIGGV